HLEERAGRTNVDDLHDRLAALRTPDESASPRPVHVSLRGCDVEFVRLVPDPGEAATRVVIEDLDVEVDVAPGSFLANWTGRVLAGGEAGLVRGSVRVADRGTSGEVETSGLDLRALAPLLGEELEGTLNLRASGTAERVEAHGDLRGLRVRGVAEEWVKLDAKLVPAERELTIDELSLSCASGGVALSGSGAVPLGGEAQEAGFAVTGGVSLPWLSRALGRETVEGTVDFELQGASEGNAVRLTGGMSAKGVVFRDRPPRDLRADLDLSFDRASRSVEIRLARAGGEGVDVELSGKAALRDAPSWSVAGGGRADLAALEPFLSLPVGASVAGRLELTDFTCAAAAGGVFSASGRAEITGLEASGLAPG
ncbi:MAG: hypothetical protein ACREID_10080, partial [Planctomycetota bacterium]